MTSTTAQLGAPLKITGVTTAKNRIFKSAMSEQLGDLNNAPTPELIRLYQTWAEGGTGLLVTGNVMIDRSALGEPRNVVLDGSAILARLVEDDGLLVIGAEYDLASAAVEFFDDAGIART